MPEQAVRSALNLTQRQLALLQQGDLDAFLEGLPGQAAACEDAAALPTGNVDPALRELFDQLVSTYMALSCAIDEALGETRDRMAVIQRGRQASAAYFDSQFPPSPEARVV